MVEADAKKFIEEFTTRLIPIKEAFYCSYFNSVAFMSDENTTECAKSETEYDRLFLDKEKAKLVEIYLQSGINDALISKQLKDLDIKFEMSLVDPHDMEEENVKKSTIIRAYGTFEYRLNELKVTPNYLGEILKKSTDLMERQSAWKELMSVGHAVADKIVEIVKLRNKIASDLGYDNHYSMSLKHQDISEEWLFSALKELKMQTDEPYEHVIRLTHNHINERLVIPISEIEPWHYSDCFFQSSEEISEGVDLDKLYVGKDIIQLVKRYYDGIGLSIDDIIRNSDLYERENKRPIGSFCLPINVNDVRIFTNLKNTEGGMVTTLHEFGHAVYNKYISSELPYLLQDIPHINNTEAIAILFERLGNDNELLHKIVGLPIDEANIIKDSLSQRRILEQLIFLRFAMVMTHFERELYRNPDQDLNKLWYDLKAKYQLQKGTGARKDFPDWAAKIHFTTMPVRYHNYIIGDMIASQIEHHIRTKVTGTEYQPGTMVDDSRIGSFLIERIFKEGSKRGWIESLEYATGEKLNLRYYTNQFVNCPIFQK